MIDLGLRLEDVDGLETEDVYFESPTGGGRTCARTAPPQEEIEFLLEQRVELNAFASDELIDWIERKLEDARRREGGPGRGHARRRLRAHAPQALVQDRINAVLCRPWGDIGRHRAARPRRPDSQMRLKGASARLGCGAPRDRRGRPQRHAGGDAMTAVITLAGSIHPLVELAKCGSLDAIPSSSAPTARGGECQISSANTDPCTSRCRLTDGQLAAFKALVLRGPGSERDGAERVSLCSISRPDRCGAALHPRGDIDQTIAFEPLVHLPRRRQQVRGWGIRSIERLNRRSTVCGKPSAWKPLTSAGLRCSQTT